MKHINLIVSIYSFIVISFIMTSCSSQMGKSCISVDMTYPTKEHLHYSDFFDSISYLQLQGIDGRPIAGIDMIKSIDSLLVVFDMVSQRVMLFNDNGEYLREIGSRGLGSGEYISSRKIDVDNEKNNILIYDIVKGSVLRYGLDGNYLGMDSVGRGNDVKYIGNGNYLVANFDEAEDDRAGIFKVSTSPYKRIKIRGCRDNIEMNKPFEFFDCENNISIMTRSYEDELLLWKKDSLISLVKIEVEQYPSENQIKDIRDNPYKRMEYADRVCFYNYADWLFIVYSYDNDNRILIYDKNKDKFELVKGLLNDIDGEYGLRLPVSINNSIVSVINKDDSLSPKIQFLHFKNTGSRQ